ncbi:MAG: HD domain-containing protein [Clostridia bacterium]|nr:HD domain-containing protein [Clostridia bacterium]
MHFFINELNAGNLIKSFYIMKDGDVKTTATGKTYLACTLADMSGTIEAKMWNYAGKIDKSCAGKIVYIEGTIQEYQSANQCVLTAIRLATENDSYDKIDLVPSAPINVRETFDDLIQIIMSIDDDDYGNVCKAIVKKHAQQIKTYPAAKSVHHSFLNGLLMHTYNMAKSADFLADIYCNCINRDLLIAGTILHDIGKIVEFEISELGLVSDYSLEGKLLGHLVIGCKEIAECCKELNIPESKGILLQHMIVSHHGKPEYGAAEMPQIAEAELLSWIDMIDSKMEIYDETFKNMDNNTFSDRIFALDGRSLYKHD